MSYKKKQHAREPRKSNKTTEEKTPLQNVISMRISDQEKKKLEKLTKSTSKSISDIMREAMDLWRLKRRSLCLDS